MGDLLGSFSESMQVRTKLAEKTRVGLWGQSVILKAVWGVTLTVETIYNSYSLLLLRTVAANTPTKCRSHLLNSSLFHSQFHMNGPPRKAEALLSYE
ncbi:hypothetical protein QL285_026598 [Trifolium repens]|nr:hypothetical protein QL285_026598 [Trifolium repens]